MSYFLYELTEKKPSFVVVLLMPFRPRRFSVWFIKSNNEWNAIVLDECSFMRIVALPSEYPTIPVCFSPGIMPVWSSFLSPRSSLTMRVRCIVSGRTGYFSIHCNSPCNMNLAGVASPSDASAVMALLMPMPLLPLSSRFSTVILLPPIVISGLYPIDCLL